MLSIGNLFAKTISVQNGKPRITQEEIRTVNSKLKTILSIDIDHGLIEDVENRIYIYGKINDAQSSNSDQLNKSTPIIAIQFWLEAGNADYQYLIVLDRKTKKTYGPLKIGGTLYRAIAIYDIRNGFISACAKFYGPNDPAPQPSIKSSVGFILGFNGIEELGTVVNDSSSPKKCIPRP
ncbi:MAG: hypothetical protein FWF46_09565 [Oscillospiraceae bacterium]|nr:hypothetical protein [Oscillospiraceae bacterium]